MINFIIFCFVLFVFVLVGGVILFRGIDLFVFSFIVMGLLLFFSFRLMIVNFFDFLFSFFIAFCFGFFILFCNFDYRIWFVFIFWWLRIFVSKVWRIIVRIYIDFLARIFPFLFTLIYLGWLFGANVSFGRLSLFNFWLLFIYFLILILNFINLFLIEFLLYLL